MLFYHYTLIMTEAVEFQMQSLVFWQVLTV